MTKRKYSRPPRPTYSEGFKNGAVQLYRTRRREHPQESLYATCVAVSETMGVAGMTIKNWVKRAEETAAELPAADAVSPAATTEAPSAGAALTALVEVLSTSGPADDAPPAGSMTADDTTDTITAQNKNDDPAATILDLRRQVAELHRANIILKSATAYLASEALKAA